MKSPPLTPDEIAAVADTKDERAAAEVAAILGADKAMKRGQKGVPTCNCGSQEWKVGLVGLGRVVECARCGTTTPIGEWEEEYGVRLTNE